MPFRPMRVLALFAALHLAAPLPAQTQPPAQSWLYRGSDIPPDTAWTFDELPNGLRYALRRNGVPPGQVSVRVAIDAGTLHERPDERGFAHFNEHLAFRGSAFVGDGEAKRVWQRLGATFGADTNAFTSPTQTVYKIDLPAATPAGIDDTLKILSGMMSAPTIAPEAVDTERRTVTAELRENQSAGRRAGERLRALLYAGQPLGNASLEEELASVGRATRQALVAFHDRWYRPSRATVVVVGDVDMKTVEPLIARHFAGWTGKGPDPADPDFGRPDSRAERIGVTVEPGLPRIVSLAVARPWVFKADTIEMNRDRQVLELAARLISRRLETRARQGAPFLSAGVDVADVARSANLTTVQIVPAGEDWEAAVFEVRRVIADALARPPLPEEIAREVEDYTADLNQEVATERVRDTRNLADSIVGAVDIRETVASAAVARDVFANLGARLQPAALLTAARQIFAGTPMRGALTLPAAQPQAEARLLAAIEAPVEPLRVDTARPVSIDALPPLGPPGTVVARAPLSPFGVEQVTLSNGVKLNLFANDAEPSRVYVSVRWGGGRASLTRRQAGQLWAADFALVASGIGPFGLDEIERLANGRRMGLDFAADDDAFVLQGLTRREDLLDQLRLMAGKLATPRWDAAPVLRAKNAALTGYDSAELTPTGVLSRALPGWLRGGDPRWTVATRDQIAALTPDAFRAAWEPLLAAGPIEVSVFGDVTADEAVKAVAATFGALPARRASPRPASPAAPRRGSTLTLTHRGPADQAAAALAWPTGGGSRNVLENRRLDVLAAIFGDRMFDALREAEGQSYSPSVDSAWPLGLRRGGAFTVIGQVRPEATARFFALAEKIAADLVAAPPSDDELQRTLGPLRERIARASSGNSFWLGQFVGSSRDPRRARNALTIGRDFAAVTAADVQATARRWLRPGKAARLVVVPEGNGPSTNLRANGSS